MLVFLSIIISNNLILMNQANKFSNYTCCLIYGANFTLATKRFFLQHFGSDTAKELKNEKKYG